MTSSNQENYEKLPQIYLYEKNNTIINTNKNHQACKKKLRPFIRKNVCSKFCTISCSLKKPKALHILHKETWEVKNK